MDGTIFEIEEVKFVPNPVGVEEEVEFHLSFTETTKEFSYGRSTNAEIYCGGEIGIL